MKHTEPSDQTSLFAIGIALICIALLLNEWNLSKMYFPQGGLTTQTRIAIWILEIALAATGIASIKYRSHAKALAALEAIPHKYRVRYQPLAWLAGILFAAVTLLALESAFFVFNARNYSRFSRSGDYTRDFFQYDANLGYVPKPNSQTSSILWADEELVYDVTYTIDEYSRRVTPGPRSDDRSKFIMFTGGSFTFGEGVEDNETLPYYVSRCTAHYRSYNYGFSGYGPQAMLARLQSDQIKTEIPEESGLLVYTFIDRHVQRAIGSMVVYSHWGAGMPYYTFDADRNLIRQGSFRSGRPEVSAWYEIIGKLQVTSYLGLDYPRIIETHFALTASIIEESRATFRDKFESEGFYVLLFPGTNAEALIPYLEAADIRYLDYRSLVDMAEPGFRIPDGHPAPKAYQEIAAQLARDVGIIDTEICDLPDTTR